MEVLNADQSALMAKARVALRASGFDSHYVTSRGEGFLTVRGHGKVRTFQVQERRRVGPDSAVGYAGVRAGAGIESSMMHNPNGEQSGFLVVAEHIGAATGASLWAQGVSYLDSLGNANIDLGDLRVEVGGRTSDRRTSAVRRPDSMVKAPESGAFSAAGLPVSLLLMSRPDVVASGPTVRDIARLVPSSLGKVQEVVSGLRDAGLLTGGNGGRVIHGGRWLSAWTEGYLRHRHKWHGSARFRTSGRGTMSMVAGMAAREDGVWLGGESAAARMGLPLRPTTALIYVDHELPTIVRTLKLRKDPTGQVELAKPLWLREGWNKPLAPSVVVRADLIASGDPRQAEMAEELIGHDEDLRRLLGR